MGSGDDRLPWGDGVDAPPRRLGFGLINEINVLTLRQYLSGVSKDYSTVIVEGHSQGGKYAERLRDLADLVVTFNAPRALGGTFTPFDVFHLGESEGFEPPFSL